MRRSATTAYIPVLLEALLKQMAPYRQPLKKEGLSYGNDNDAKILAKHAHRDSVSAGDLLVSQVDLVLANDITGPPAINEFEKSVNQYLIKTKLLWFRTISPPARISNPQPCASVCVTSPASTKSKTTLK